MGVRASRAEQTLLIAKICFFNFLYIAMMKINLKPTNIFNIKRGLPKTRPAEKLSGTSGCNLPEISVVSTKNVYKINKLINNFFRIFTDEIPETEKSKDPLPIKILCSVLGGIAKSAMKYQAIKPNNVTKIVKIGKKDAGGYVFVTDKENDMGYVMLLSLDKKYHHTRAGNKALFDIAKDIYLNAKEKNISRISWQVDRENKRAANLFSRFKTETETYKSADNQVISTEEFGNTLKRYRVIDMNA